MRKISVSRQSASLEAETGVTRVLSDWTCSDAVIRPEYCLAIEISNFDIFEL